MKKIFFLLVVLIFAMPLTAGAVEMADLGGQKTQGVQDAASKGAAGTLISSQTDISGKTTATYQNADRSYTVIETDASGKVLSSRNFSGPSALRESQFVEAGSNLIRVDPNGMVSAEGMLSEKPAVPAVVAASKIVNEGIRTVIQTDKEGNVVSRQNFGGNTAGEKMPPQESSR